MQFRDQFYQVTVAKKSGFMSLAEEVEEILYGEEPEKIRFESKEEAEKFVAEFYSSTHFCYLNIVCIV